MNRSYQLTKAVEVQINVTIRSIDSRDGKFNAFLIQDCVSLRISFDHVALFVLRTLFGVDPVHQSIKGVQVLGEVQHTVARTTDLIQYGLNRCVLLHTLFFVVVNAA